jgi:hypothetical protein
MAERAADALDAAIGSYSVARPLHAIAGFNDREQRSLNLLLYGFTAHFPIKDVLKDARGFFKFTARLLPRF